MSRNSKFLQREFFRTLFAIMISVLGGTVNTLVDSAFVSQRLGADGLAAVNMSMPVYLIICTLGALIGGGADTLSAQELGKKDLEKSNIYYHRSLFWSLVLGGILSISGIVCGRFIGRMLAQGGELTAYVSVYSTVTITGAIFIILAYLPIYYLQLDGKNREITIMMVVMVGTDILSDYLFLYVFNLGMFGAALASVLATFAATAYGFFMLERGFSNYHFQKNKLSAKGFGEIVKVGSPIAMGNLVDCAKLLCLNAIVLYAGGTQAAAIWAVLNALMEFSMMIVSGIPQTAAPLVANFYSAKENVSIRILIKLQVIVGIITSGIYGAVILILHRPLEMLFSSAESLVLPFVCVACFVMLDTLGNVWSVYFIAIKKTVLANSFVVLRKFVFPVGTAIIISKKNLYLWLFLPLAGVFFLVAGYVEVSRQAKKTKHSRHELSRILLLDDYLEKEHKIFDFSLTPTAENICDASAKIQDFCMENKMNAKETVRLGLAIEEIMTIIKDHDADLQSVDLRAFAQEAVMGVVIRYSGKPFDPFADEDEDNLSIMMMKNMSSLLNYSYSIGINMINIVFDR